MYKNTGAQGQAGGDQGAGGQQGPFGSKPYEPGQGGASSSGPKAGSADDVDYRVVDEEEKK